MERVQDEVSVREAEERNQRTRCGAVCAVATQWGKSRNFAKGP